MAAPAPAVGPHGRSRTRARAQSSGLARSLREPRRHRGGGAAIRIEPIAGAAPDLRGYDLVCLTSPNGVRLLFERLRDDGRDARALAGARVAAIGPGTARALSEHGVIADVVPERFVAEGLVEALADMPVSRALIARAAVARDVLPEALRARGAEVDVLASTRPSPSRSATSSAPRSPAPTTSRSRPPRPSISSSSRRERMRRPGPGWSRFGPVTSDAWLRSHGREPDVEAGRHDIDGLLDALVADAGERPV